MSKCETLHIQGMGFHCSAGLGFGDKPLLEMYDVGSGRHFAAPLCSRSAIALGEKLVEAGKASLEAKP